MRNEVKKLFAFVCVCAAICFSAPLFAEAGDGTPCVSNLIAENSFDGIKLSWTLPESEKRSNILFFAIYRDTRPIYSSTRVKGLAPLAAVPKNHVSYTDTMVSEDSKSYYYAVLTFIDEDAADSAKSDLYYDEQLDGSADPADEDGGTLYSAIFPGVNSTITGIKYAKANVPAEKKAASAFKEQLPKDMQESKNSKHGISHRAEDRALELAAPGGARKKSPLQLERYIFTEDMVAPSGGDEYILYATLQRSWIKGRYTAAKQDLDTFLSQNRDKKVASRALFYIAEAEYFTENYDKALNYFVQVQDVYPQLALKWIDSCLDLYDNK